MIGVSNCAKDVPPMSLTLVETTSSGNENLYVVFSTLPTQASPERSVKNFVVLSFVAPTFISPILNYAVAAVLLESGQRQEGFVQLGKALAEDFDAHKHFYQIAL